VSRWPLLLWSIVVAGCSDLTEGAGGAVGLEIQEPADKRIEIGQALQLSASAIDKDGNPVGGPVEWRAADPTLSVDANGVITGVAAGQGRVQAFTGSLSSQVLTFTVIVRADTLVLVGDSVVTVAPGVTSSAPLVVQTRTFVPDDPLPGRDVIYGVTSPPDVGPHTVELTGGVLTDTLTTGTPDGTVTAVTLNRVNGTAQPDTAIVTVIAPRPHGDPVAGSGQRFLVVFQ
jgi:hypothetical protein